MMNDLFSAKTRKSLQLRENWLSQLFANTKIEPGDKVVMAVLTFWYFPLYMQPGGPAPLDYAVIAEMAGMPEEEVREIILTMAEVGILQLQDEHGHKLDVVDHYTCQDCGHEWDEKHEHEHSDTSMHAVK